MAKLGQRRKGRPRSTAASASAWQARRPAPRLAAGRVRALWRRFHKTTRRSWRTYKPAAVSSVGVVKEVQSWVAFFCTKPNATSSRKSWKAVADRGAIEHEHALLPAVRWAGALGQADALAAVLARPSFGRCPSLAHRRHAPQRRILAQTTDQDRARRMDRAPASHAWRRRHR